MSVSAVSSEPAEPFPIELLAETILWTGHQVSCPEEIRLGSLTIGEDDWQRASDLAARCFFRQIQGHPGLAAYLEQAETIEGETWTKASPQEKIQGLVRALLADEQKLVDDRGQADEHRLVGGDLRSGSSERLLDSTLYEGLAEDLALLRIRGRLEEEHPRLEVRRMSAQEVRDFLQNPAHQSFIQSIEILDFSNLGLFQLPKEILRFTGLRMLDLAENRLKRVPDMTGLPLRWLYLLCNRIDTLDGATFPETLEELDLEDNDIRTLSGAKFPNGLRILYLEGNECAPATSPSPVPNLGIPQ